MAPAARIAVYKAVWHRQDWFAMGETVDLVAAIEQAVLDGVDVINYSVSIGGAGELTAIRRRHAQVVARLVARTAPELAGADLLAAVHRLDEVSGDISSALAHAAVDDPLTALRLAAALSRWWRFRGRDVPGRQWLRRLLADPRTADAGPVLRAWASLGVARLAAEHVRPGDVVIVSGPIGDHGVTIMLARGSLDIEADVASDTAPLWPAVDALLGVRL